MTYIHELADWPHFRWNDECLAPRLAEVRHRQGRLIGRMEALGFDLRAEASLETLTEEVVRSSEIEGEVLDRDQVRSSLARRLGMDLGGLIPTDRNVEGVVEMMLDATQNHSTPLTVDRLSAWHAALFPTGRSGNPARLDAEMAGFLDWFEQEASRDPVVTAALSHLWFVTIHPFEDGNGRIARAIADLALARSDGNQQRFYGMSTQIRLERKAYFDILERTQKGDLDITPWLAWFLDCLDRAFEGAESIMSTVLRKARFWEAHCRDPLNERQRKVIDRLLDGFEGTLTSSKWAALTKSSQDTAGRDIDSLIQLGVLVRNPGGGRSTSYSLAEIEMSGVSTGRP